MRYSLKKRGVVPRWKTENALRIYMVSVCACVCVDDQPSRRGKRSKAAASLGVDMDGVCITYTRSQPPSTARAIDNSDNVFAGAFPQSDRWLTSDAAERNVDDLFEKARRRSASVSSSPSSSYEFILRLLQNEHRCIRIGHTLNS